MEVNVSERAPVRPLIYKYRCYRKFLTDTYAFKKSLRAGFSYRRFSQVAGLKSPNYLQLVMQGKRNLSDEMAEQIAKALTLENEERAFFVNLVALENARSETHREKLQAELLRKTKRLATKEIPKAQISVLGEWYHLLIRELVVLPDFEPSGEWISSKLRGVITSSEAEASLNLLLKSGFLIQKKEKFEQAEPVIDTGDAFGEVQVLSVHKGVLESWATLLPKVDRDTREVGLINIPVASEKLPELKNRIRKFQDEIIGWLESESAPDRIVQLGTYMIPVTTGPGEPK